MNTAYITCEFWFYGYGAVYQLLNSKNENKFQITAATMTSEYTVPGKNIFEMA